MSKLRRYYQEGNMYFVINVTLNRKPILLANADLLQTALRKVSISDKVEIVAWVVLPDHFHLLIDPAADDLSNIMRKIKLSFSSSLRKRQELMSGRTWQYRFWDHAVRNQDNLNHHIDYIHYNPVKHGLVKSPFDYLYSSLHLFAKEGYYQMDWGVKEIPEFAGNYGE